MQLKRTRKVLEERGGLPALRALLSLFVEALEEDLKELLKEQKSSKGRKKKEG